MKLRFLFNTALCAICFSILVAHCGFSKSNKHVDKQLPKQSSGSYPNRNGTINRVHTYELETIISQPSVNFGEGVNNDSPAITEQPDRQNMNVKQNMLEQICPEDVIAFVRGSSKCTKSCTDCIQRQCPPIARRLSQFCNTPHVQIGGTALCSSCFAIMGALNDLGISNTAKYAMYAATYNNISPTPMAMGSSQYCIPNCCCPCCWPCHATVMGTSPCYFSSVLCAGICCLISTKQLCNKVIKLGKNDSVTEEDNNEEPN